MPFKPESIQLINRAREQAGFLSLEETAALVSSGNIVFDPFSTLISRKVAIGAQNVFHPNTRIACHEDAMVEIGSGNVFHSNTVIEASMNRIAIGDHNQFGEGMVCLKANAPDAFIEVGNLGRYCGIISLYGRTRLGSGSQILGNITAYNCVLGEGCPHSHPVPDERGSVLKGSGTAKNIQLTRGQVIEGWGRFDAEAVTRQSSFHPPTSQSGA